MYPAVAQAGVVKGGVDGINGKRVRIVPLAKAKANVVNGTTGDSRLRVRIGRGFKRCSSCGEISAQRLQLCRNPNCELRKQMLLMHRSFDAVRLVTHTGSDLYSVRNKEREPQPRNFVQITDVTLALERTSAIVSRNAICFVDTCKYDSHEATNISCKHVKACTEDVKKSVNAEVYLVAHEVLWNLNIPLELKMKLWDMYKEDEQRVPAVQRLNDSTFVVKCTQSKNFPAGRLHVQALANLSQMAKKAKHACACKKLKIIVEPDNSVVMQEEICDHLLLLLAAVLSKQNGKTMYANFTNALKSFWMPASLDIPLADATQENALFDFSINIDGNASLNDPTAADDIFIFGNDFLPNDDIPDFPDNILKSVINLPESCQSIFNDLNNAVTNTIYHPGDPNLVSNGSLIEDIDIKFNDIHNAATVATVHPLNGGSECTTHMELSDCNIELMDQFQQLTDQIDLCSEDITMPESSNGLFFTDSISIMAAELSESTEQNNNHFDSLNVDIKPISTNQSLNCNTNTLLKSNHLHGNKDNSSNNLSNNNMQVVHFQQLQPPTVTTNTPTALPPIEMPTIAVVKKEPIKTCDIVTEVKTRKFPYIPAKRPLIVNDLDKVKKAQIQTVEHGPAMAYSAWLDYVIEVINESVVFGTDSLVKHQFHVHEETFAHFSKSFSIGLKRRMPNSSCMIKTGKHKGLMRYIWIFSTATTVQRIFTTKNITIELQRTFEKHQDGYVPYVRRVPCETAEKHRRIYPRLELYVAHIWFDCSNENHMTGIKIEWLPNAFPTSHFGILNIQFSLGYKLPV